MQVCIIGLGLIGGSIAKALKPSGYCHRIIAFDHDKIALSQAKEWGIIDDYTDSLISAVEQADIIILAVPLRAIPDIFQGISQAMPKNAILTDVTSVKQTVITYAQQFLTDEQLAMFVPAHPIAGSEKSGVVASQAKLFNHHTVILTPLEVTSLSACTDINGLWQRMGAQTLTLSAKQHDEMLGLTSHLPQLVAYTLMNTLIANQPLPSALPYLGAGFKDTSRLAASDPELWLDICLANREVLLHFTQSYKQQLICLENALANNDNELILKIFSSSSKNRKLIA